MPRRPLPSFAPLLLAFVLPSALTALGCAPKAPPRSQGEAPRHQRGIGAGARLLAFRGRASQMGDLRAVASAFQVIAVDAEPDHGKFSQADIDVLRAGGRNIVLGFVHVGYCDRREACWTTAPDGLLPCRANLPARIGERRGHPQEVWMDPEDFEYQRLIIEYVAPRIEKTGVDGFLIDGLELLDHDPDENEAPCDNDCIEGAIGFLVELRKDFPDLVFVMEGGLSGRARREITSATTSLIIDGIVGEEVYAPSYDAEKEAELLAWKAMGLKINGQPFAVFTQDYVNDCSAGAQAQSAYQASRSHGFLAAVAPSPMTSRPTICSWSLGK